MPDAEAGCSSLLNIFFNHIYKDVDPNISWLGTAAISGAHTLGGNHLNQSGYNGSFTSYQSKGIFNNDYYKNLLV